MSDGLLAEIGQRLARAAQRDPRTSIEGLLLSRHETSEPDYQLTEPLFILMAQGRKRLYVGPDAIEYGTGECLVVTANLPLSGHFVDATPERPALAVALTLRPSDIAALLPKLAGGRRIESSTESAVGTHIADARLLDAIARLLRLLDHPADAGVLAPLVQREILWRLLTGPSGEKIARIGLADSSLVHVGRAIAWIRENFAEPIPIRDLAAIAGMSTSTFHRHFRVVTGLTPLQFQKLLQLQEARSLLLAGTHDVTGVAHLIGYNSPTQFNREYRRQFGSPPGRDAGRLRNAVRA